MSSSRLTHKVRKAELIAVALKVARIHGYTNMTRAQIAEEAKVTDSLVSKYWGTMHQVRRSVMRHAIISKDAVIVAQGLAVKDEIALKAPDELRRQAAVQLLAGV